MLETRYLLVGSSHAALEALAAIRMHDAEGSVLLATRDTAPPYSPTVLPYVVSGKSDPNRVRLRSDDFCEAQKVTLRSGSALASLDTAAQMARFADGTEVRYERLLLATGATPAIPKIAGLTRVQYHVLRTLDDAVRLREALGRARRAVVLGGGLVGMHAAENLVHARTETTIIEMQPQVLPGYFDAQAASLISGAFAERGTRVLCGQSVVSVAPRESGFALKLLGGERVEGDLLLIAAGVRPTIGYLSGAGVATGDGVLVDRRMRTSASNVWAAGDVAQAESFLQGGRRVNGILPNAVEQGRIAGMDMAGDPGARDYRGGVPINTYHFFGRQALSVGVDSLEGCETHVQVDEAAGRYRKIVLKDGRLAGIFSIDLPFDAGVMVELVLRGTDLAPVKQAFLENPRDTARALMSRLWR
ncbi:MAG: phenylglyoxylate dehydrogenase [Betaproteobacteria bacterium RIFCSPLOWO2_02_FULL_66_14]|nr:MAG: phenylglyoxylate dehydrogenase [Betaproteobacteria bacterium RIFCSPLOWO2_02_FULL_66_14]